MSRDTEARHIDDGVILGYPTSRVEAGALVLGEDPRLRTGTVIYEGSHIGARFQTGHNVVIREQSRIGDDVSIWSNTVVDYGCVIGDRVKIHCNCYVAQFTEIDEDAFLAPGVIVGNDLYPGRVESAREMRGPVIEAGAQIGINATILPYVTIGAARDRRRGLRRDQGHPERGDRLRVSRRPPRRSRGPGGRRGPHPARPAAGRPPARNSYPGPVT